MKIPILRLRDKDGKEIVIPAIRGQRGLPGDGSGDMVAAIYDPTGKAVDIFAYSQMCAAREADRVGRSLWYDVTSGFAAKDHVHAEYAPAQHEHNYAKVLNFTVNVGSTWQPDTANGGHFQTIALSGILASDDPIADVVLSENVASNKDALSAWSKVTRITTAAGTVTLWCNEEAPATSFAVKLKVVR